MAPPRDPLGFAGALIDGQIQVGEPVGEGGFSVVYRAKHLGLSEPVAFKCLKAQVGSKMTDAIVERFRAESRISYRLSQGNLDIVRSLSSGAAHSPLTGELVPYITLEWLDGPSLQQELKLRRSRNMKGRPLREVLEILEPAALALDYAHKQGVVHRDVKPGNLVLAKTREGGSRIKVLDFGLAKVIDPDGIGLVPTATTVTSVILCSPAYGAPEQFDPMLGPIGNYTDVYSFALIVLEMLRDEKVRNTTAIAAAAQHALSHAPISPLALNIPVSPAIDALFRRTVQRDRSQRPKDMGEFWTALTKLAARASPPTVVEAVPFAAPPQPAGSGPTLQDMPIPMTTVPMQSPPVMSQRGPALPKSTMIMPQRPLPPGAQATGPAPPGAAQPPEAARPGPPQQGKAAYGPATVPMPAVQRPSHGGMPAVHGRGAMQPQSPLDTGSMTRAQPLVAPGASAAASPEAFPPGAPPGPTPPVPPPGPSALSPGAVSPGAVSPAATSSPAPAAAPPAKGEAAPAKKERSRVGVVLLSMFLLILFSAGVVTAGYFAHRWYAARHAS